MKSGRQQMMVFMPLVVVLIGQFSRDVIGRQNVKVVLSDWSVVLLLFSIRLFVEVYISVSFEVTYESFVRCK